MTVQALQQLLATLPPDYQVEFLCPDGYLDDIEADCEVVDGAVRFVSYVHREKKSNRPKKGITSFWW